MLIKGTVSDILAQVEGANFDLIITSPPYSMGKDYEKTRSLGDYLTNFESVLKELKRVLKEEGNIA